MNINIRNLSPETSLAELLGNFEIFGTVTDVTISTYTIDGKLRGLGFIEMPSNDHGLAAVAGLQGKVLDGNLLKVQEE